MEISISVCPADIPDGSHDGLQSGYEFVSSDGHALRTLNGVRGQNIQCSVEVKGGQIVKHSLGDFLITPYKG